MLINAENNVRNPTFVYTIFISFIAVDSKKIWLCGRGGGWEEDFFSKSTYRFEILEEMQNFQLKCYFLIFRLFVNVYIIVT